MSLGDKIAFSCDLTSDQHRKLKCLAEYSHRNMTGQIRAMIDLDYEEMKGDLT